jgi:hypothetical protein
LGIPLRFKNEVLSVRYFEVVIDDEKSDSGVREEGIVNDEVIKVILLGGGVDFTFDVDSQVQYALVD